MAVCKRCGKKGLFLHVNAEDCATNALLPNASHKD